MSAAEASRLGVPAGAAVPAGVARRLDRCLEAPIEELVRRKVIPSSEVLAIVLPQITSQVAAAGIADPELARLYGAIYAAFRRRRSLLLLDLQSQVKLEELPWIAAIDALRARRLAETERARQALEHVATLAVTSFPETILPNKLLQEMRALVKEAGLGLPLVDELAADIFMGELSGKFLEGVIGERGVEAPEQLVGADEADAVACLAGTHAEADGEVGLADAARPDPQDRLAAVDEAELGEVEHGLAIEAGLLLEVVVLDAADLGKLGVAHAPVGAGLVAREHLGFHHARDEGEVPELERAGLLEVLVEVVGRVGKPQALEILDQSIPFFTRHRPRPPSSSCRCRWTWTGTRCACRRASCSRRASAGARPSP